jgi:hypothetical protein
MRIKKKFIKLTKYTYPNGTESLLEKFLPSGYQVDEFGNYYIEIGEDSRTMFTCHLDTACLDQEEVNHRFDGKYIGTDGKTILGADDKAGMCIILYMIEKKIPGLYYFFLGEEVGCIGSRALAKLFKNTEHGLDRVVSFDRRGTNSIITHQFYGRCCSDEFAIELSNRLNSYNLKLKPDPTGISTDSASFMDIIPECTNISVGYYEEHTHDEYQDIEFLRKIAEACIRIDWETLPTKRDPNYNEWSDWVDDDGSNYGTWPNYELTYGYYKKPKQENYTYIIDTHGDSVKAIFSDSRIEYEKKLILSVLRSQGQIISDINWNGTTCTTLNERGIQEYIGNRSALIPFIDELSSIPYSELTIQKKRQTYVL